MFQAEEVASGEQTLRDASLVLTFLDRFQVGKGIPEEQACWSLTNAKRIEVLFLQESAHR